MNANTDGTVYQKNDANARPQAAGQGTVESNAAPQAAQSAAEKLKWRAMAFGGVSGIALGGAAVAGALHAIEAMSATPSVDIVSLDAETGEPIEPAEEQGFAEAFEAARAELGAGGTFVWNGQVFSTYTPEEWESLSQEEQMAEAEAAEAQPVAAEPEPMAELEADMEADIVDIVDPDAPAGIEPEPMEMPQPEPLAAAEPEPDIQVGGATTIDDVDFYPASIDGQDLVFIDVDRDGTPDYVAADLNGDGELQEGEIIDLDSGEALSDLIYDAEPQEELAEADVMTMDNSVDDALDIVTTDEAMMLDEDPKLSGDIDMTDDQLAGSVLDGEGDLPDYMSDADVDMLV